MTKLTNAYSLYNFKEIRKIFIEISKNPFTCIQDKEDINNIFYRNLKLKNIINKIIIKNRLYKVSKIPPVNKYLLDLSSESDQLTSNYLDIYTDSSFVFYHRFSINELGNMFKASLSNQAYGRANPFTPLNPYSGEPFKEAEIYKIFAYFSYHNIKMPIQMELLKLSKFDPMRMVDLFDLYFIKQSSETYIKDFTDSEWFEYFYEFCYSSRIKKKICICLKCLKLLPNIRILFTKGLVVHFLESNGIYNTPDEDCAVDIILNVIKENNLEADKNHYLKHRKRKLGGGLNLGEYNPLVDLNFDFTSSIKPNEVFYFKSDPISESFTKITKSKNFVINYSYTIEQIKDDIYNFIELDDVSDISSIEDIDDMDENFERKHTIELDIFDSELDVDSSDLDDFIVDGVSDMPSD